MSKNKRRKLNTERRKFKEFNKKVKDLIKR